MNANSTTPNNNYADPNALTGWVKQLGIAALYALLLYIGELILKMHAITGHFDPSAGLALAVLLLGGKRYAWGVFLIAALIHSISGDSLWSAVIVASGDALQALCSAWLITRSGKFDLHLQTLRAYLRLILLGGCIGIAFSDLAVSAVLLGSGLLATESFFPHLLSRWMGDMLGVVLITPLIMVWWQTKNDWRNTGQKLEAVLLIGLTVFIGQIVFLDWLHDSIGLVAKAYWMFIFITLVATRLGTQGTTIALLAVAAQALSGAILGTGFFADDIAKTHLLNYWFFAVIISLVGMTLATHFAERRTAESSLAESEERFRLIVETIDDVFWMADVPIEGMHYISAAYERIWGRTCRSLYENPHSFVEAIHPEDRERVLLDLDVQKAGQPFNHEYRVVRPDGAIRWVWDRGFPIIDKAGKVTRYAGVVKDITERKQTERQLHDLAAHIQAVREEEKTGIAREIHDDLGGTLTALKIETHWLKTKLSANEGTTPLLAHIGAISQLIDNAESTMHSIISGLRPAVLDDLGLLAALEWQAAQFQKLTGIECRVNCVCAKDEDCTKELDELRSTALFRICQEALTNVAKHSGASRVEVEFHRSDAEIVVSIIDNGRGMAKERTDASIPYGILGMTERIDQLGGKISFDTPPGGGFNVTVILPLPANEEEKT